MKPKDLTLPELKVGELPKPEEKVKVDWNVWAEQEALLEVETQTIQEIPDFDYIMSPEEVQELVDRAELNAQLRTTEILSYKDLGDLTQEEWQEVFGRNQ